MILTAKVYDVCWQTPLQEAPRLSARIGNRVYLKREDLQHAHSFKLRGAYNCIAHLSPEERAKGICACSAGNHAQGVAYSARALELSAKIFMPTTTPTITVEAVQSCSNARSSVMLVGDSHDEVYAATLECAQQEGRKLVHAFNDPLVIAGQGTIGMEIVAQRAHQEVDVVFCGVGGGGLLSGVGMYLKAVRPSIKVIGVEAADALPMIVSLRAGHIFELASAGRFADGAALRKVGDESFRLCQLVADDMVTVSTDEICAAIKSSFPDTRVVLEPAGALAVAGMVRYARDHGLTGKTLIAVASGANGC